MNQNKTIQQLKPPVRYNKNFVYNNKKYQIDFNWIKINSNYFYEHRYEYEDIQDIQLIEESIDNFEDSIPCFISSCHNESFEINDSNVFSLYILSIKYEVPSLIQLTDDFIKKYYKSFIFKSIQYKYKNTKETTTLSSIEKDEEYVASNFFDCINDDQLLNLPIPILYRIINHPKLDINELNESNKNKLIDFLFKCLDKYQKEASVLFLNLDLENQRIEIFSKIINKYSNIFDFNMISPKFLMKTSRDLLSELSQLRCNYSNSVSQISQLLNQIQDERQINQKRFSEIEQKLTSYGKNQQKETIENEKFQNQMKLVINEMKRKMEEQEKIILKYQESNEQLSNSIMKYENHMIKIEEDLRNYKDLKEKITQQEQIIIEYKQKNDQLENVVSDHQKTIDNLLKIFQLNAKINANVESIYNIKGTIEVSNIINTFDRNRSKYLLNTNSSPKLGEKEYKNGTSITNLIEQISYKNQPAGTYYLHAIIFDMSSNYEELISSPLIIKNSKLTFEYTGHVQSVSLAKGTYKLEVWGSSGGDNEDSSPGKNYNKGKFSGYSGKGGYSSGTLKLDTETKLYVYVGESPKSSRGGWNGGGSCSLKGAGGGGATDISLYGSDGSSEWNTSNHMYSRIIFAGGGGGSSHTEYQSWNGGHGGGANGGNNGNNSVKGGQQTTGNGFGVGGESTANDDSGGGGGWYGGYANDSSSWWGRGGGGGSGFVYNSSTASSYPNGCKLNSSLYLSDSLTIAGNAEFPSITGSGTEIGHNGNGYAKITPL